MWIKEFAHKVMERNKKVQSAEYGRGKEVCMRNKGKAGKALALFLAGALLLGGCGQSGSQEGALGRESGENPGRIEQTDAGSGSGGSGDESGDWESGAAMGRFSDSEVELPGEMDYPKSLVQDGSTIRAIDAEGMDYVSTDNGESFQYDTAVPEAYLELIDQDCYVDSLAVSPDGSRLVSLFGMNEEDGGFYHYLITADGSLRELVDTSQFYGMKFICGEDGSFYCAAGGDGSIYQIDSVSGGMTFLFQTGAAVGYLAQAGNYLYAVGDSDIWLYDLAAGEQAKEDAVLLNFLKSSINGITAGEYPDILISPGSGEDDIYVVTKEGLYHHVLYGTTMEQIIDGSLCSIGDTSRLFADMAVIRGKEWDSFLIMYADGTLMRFVYDPDIPTVPEETLRIYGLYEDSDVSLAVSYFKQEHPDVYVKYEVGVTEESGVTKEDALKALSTEIAAGKGPDVLVMDGIPYDSYIEKGVLTDLEESLSAVKAQLFENITDSYRRDGKLYAVPMTFAVPVLSGKDEVINGLDTLEELADKVEELRAQQPEGSLISFGDAKSALMLLAISSGMGWLQEKSLNEDAITEFLIQAKRIYDAQMSGLSEEETEYFQNSQVSSWDTVKGVQLVYALEAASREGTAMYLGQPLSLGLLKSSIYSYSFYSSLLRAQGKDFRFMPGQSGRMAIASSLLAVNQSSKNQKLAQEFVLSAVSEAFQGSAYLDGICINKAAYEKQKEYPYSADPDQAIGMISVDNDEFDAVEIFWPNEEQQKALDEIISSVEAAGGFEDHIYEAVIELGALALTGEKSIEESVDAIAQRVKLYLAE